MSAAAISGTFADYRLVKSRGVLQLVVEIPVELQAEAFEALGYPVPGTDIHVAIARLQPILPAGAHLEKEDARVTRNPPAGGTASERGKVRYRNASDMQKAVIRAARLPKDERFRAWVSNAAGWVCDERDAADYIRHEMRRDEPQRNRNQPRRLRRVSEARNALQARRGLDGRGPVMPLAFSLPRRRKVNKSGIERAPKRQWPRHEAFVRRHSCVVPGCENQDIEFMHLRSAANAGTGLKPHSRFGVSGCREHHAEAHRIGHDSFARKYGIDLWAIAAAFVKASPDVAMKEAIREEADDGR